MLVYLITNTLNGRRYVGSTKRSAERRLAEHFSKSRHPIYELHKDMAALGRDHFKIEVVTTAGDFVELLRAERDATVNLGTLISQGGYNIALGASKPCSDQTKAKLSDARKTRGTSPAQAAHLMTLQAQRRARMAAKPPKTPDTYWADLAARMQFECGPEHRAGGNRYVGPSGRVGCRACNRRAQARVVRRCRSAA